MEGLDRNLIDGDLRPSSSGATFATLNPATEEVLGQAADATSEDLDAAIAAARRAFDETDWSRDHAFRVHCVRQLRDALPTFLVATCAFSAGQLSTPLFGDALGRTDIARVDPQAIGTVFGHLEGDAIIEVNVRYQG